VRITWRQKRIHLQKKILASEKKGTVKGAQGVGEATRRYWYGFPFNSKLLIEGRARNRRGPFTRVEAGRKGGKRRRGDLTFLGEFAPLKGVGEGKGNKEGGKGTRIAGSRRTSKGPGPRQFRGEGKRKGRWKGRKRVEAKILPARPCTGPARAKGRKVE